MDIFTINLAHYLSGVNCMLELNVTACSTNIVGCMRTKSFHAHFQVYIYIMRLIYLILTLSAPQFSLWVKQAI